MKPEYEPKDTESRLGYLVEECGEVLSGVGKAIRWGLDSTNPELRADLATPDERDRVPAETNRDWILRELHDLEGAIAHARIACCENCDGGGRVQTKERATSEMALEAGELEGTMVYSTADCPDCQQYRPTGGTDVD